MTTIYKGILVSLVLSIFIFGIYVNNLKEPLLDKLHAQGVENRASFMRCHSNIDACIGGFIKIDGRIFQITNGMYNPSDWEIRIEDLFRRNMLDDKFLSRAEFMVLPSEKPLWDRVHISYAEQFITW